MTKYIFITGGVVSSLGKGLSAAALSATLESRGLKIALLKFDPYLNVDPGTMNPFEHGEVYVTDDGAETDLDLGHYYRFTNSPLSKASNATSGQIYEKVLQYERKGDYLGKTVQVIPHVTDEIKARILLCKDQKPDLDLIIVEVGGTIGDIESLPFLEALRQFRLDHPENCLNIHVTYVPYLPAAGEVKTKPTQHSVQALRAIGIIPDMILCRCEEPLDESLKKKISLFCSVQAQFVIDVADIKTSIYELPVYLKEKQLDSLICKKLNLNCKVANLKKWQNVIKAICEPKSETTIGVVGKYLSHQDAYKSVFEALHHGGIYHQTKVNIRCIESDKIKSPSDFKRKVQGCFGVLVPGGFGERGWDGKLIAAQYCREHNLPYFGICLGMQVMAVEFARNVAGLKNANSLEMSPETKDPVIAFLDEQKMISHKGGTMRLGAYECKLDKQSKAYKAYGKSLISERHRHRLEFNSKYQETFAKQGFIVSGTEPTRKLCEIAEIKNHPWMIGVQFHPEFLSKPTNPHPLFRDFIKAIINKKRKKKT